MEALKFITLNPAKQLGIDSWVGSLKVGKDADLAIWTGPPLDYRTNVNKHGSMDSLSRNMNQPNELK